jgi:hypothetical protein
VNRFGLTVSVVLASGLLVAMASGGSAAADAPVAATSNRNASVTSISCPAAGDCTAGGYDDGVDGQHAFVVSERNGAWGDPLGVLGLGGRGATGVDVISCSASGDCAAGGHYDDRRGNQRVFVVSETHGSWGKAIQVPGMATLNDVRAGLDSISCGAPGDCAASGSYHRSGHKHAFVVSEANGSWGKAVEVPGALNSGGYAEANSVSCAAAGDCVAGGYYTGAPPDYRSHAFVVTETNGSWGAAIEVPGTAALNTGGEARVDAVSCAAVGGCVAGGFYTDGSGKRQAFVAGETSGNWDDAIELPGSAALNTGGDARVESLSCPAVGECAASGFYSDDSENRQALVVSEASGSWGDAIEVPGTAALNTGDESGDAEMDSISCTAAGDCAVGGFLGGCCYQLTLVASETNGTWATAIEVPGTKSDYGYADVNSVSCAPAGECTAGGFYVEGSPHYDTEAFAVSETNGTWGSAIDVFLGSCHVPDVVGESLRAAKKKLKAHACGLGKVTKTYSTVEKGFVVAQQSKPGRYRDHGAKVALTLSKGMAP